MAIRQIRCSAHGVVSLTSEQYNHQMDNSNYGWICPICGRPATFYAELWPCLDRNCTGLIDTECASDVCPVCGKSQEDMYYESLESQEKGGE